MGFYFRKSISVGPLRFNLSKSGVGVSAGVRGFRIGSGPRGNYVHMGTGGFYYRATLPGGHTQRNVGPRNPSSPPAPLPNITTVQSTSADAASMVSASAHELLREINEKHQTFALFPLAIGACIVGCLVALVAAALAGGAFWLLLLAVLPLGVLAFVAYRRDQMRKTTVLMYDLSSPIEQTYQALHARADALRSCAGKWFQGAQSTAHDKRYHAGAGVLVNRAPLAVVYANPPWIKSNLEAIAVRANDLSLYFFPDRVLVYDRSGVGAIEYPDLMLDVRQTTFIEERGAPPDAQVVDQTWKYVNKNGTPDRRFAANFQIPVCLYDELAVHSASGLQLDLQFSRTGVALPFGQAIRALQHVITTLAILPHSPPLSSATVGHRS